MFNGIFLTNSLPIGCRHVNYDLCRFKLLRIVRSWIYLRILAYTNSQYHSLHDGWYWSRWYVRDLSANWSNKSKRLNRKKDAGMHEEGRGFHYNHVFDQRCCFLLGLLIKSWRAKKLLFFLWSRSYHVVLLYYYHFLSIYCLGYQEIILKERWLLWGLPMLREYHHLLQR